MAKTISKPQSKLLQELFRDVPSILQDQLREAVKLQEQFELAKIDLENVLREVEEMLILGSPIEPGELTVTLDKGRLVVCKAPKLEENDDAIPY